MAEIVAYGIVGSPYLRAALLGFEEKNVPYRVVAMAPGEAKAPAHLARHPFGRVPAIQHGDFALYETQAIMRYTDAVFPGVALRPAEPRATARLERPLSSIASWRRPSACHATRKAWLREFRKPKSVLPNSIG